MVVSFVFHKMNNLDKNQQNTRKKPKKPKQSSDWFPSKAFILPSISWLSTKGAGPHILTVPSSEALAIMAGTCGFQLTQFTVRVCPVSSAMGSSLRLCQMYTLWSGPNTESSVSSTALHRPSRKPTALIKPMSKTRSLQCGTALTKFFF